MAKHKQDHTDLPPLSEGITDYERRLPPLSGDPITAERIAILVERLEAVEKRGDTATGKTGGTIMAALLLEGGVDYLTPAIAAECREAALILHGVEDDAPGEEQ